MDWEKLSNMGQGTGNNSLQPTPLVEIWGNFPENLPKSQEYLLLVFSPSSLPLKKRWRNNGLSADFLADYLTTFFPGDENDRKANAKQIEIQSTVSYIANELLENAMKYSDHHSAQPITIQLQLYLDKLVFLVTNSVESAGKEKYQSFIQEALATMPDEMLLQILEKNAENDTLDSSGLGLITMMTDYQAKFGWKFEILSENPELMTVTTLVQVTL